MDSRGQVVKDYKERKIEVSEAVDRLRALDEENPPHIDKNLSTFTFHNVSINSRLKTVGHMKLIPFTFHNVSINSGYLLYESKPYPHYLHSIMYLLIR